MNEFLYSPFFGLTLSLGVYILCKVLNDKTKLAILNPLLLATVIVIAILTIFDIPLEAYNAGGDIINMFLGPATTVLAYSIYKQITLLKKNFIPIAIGCLVGSITSMGSTYLLCNAFGINNMITASLMPKSVTTPIAMEVSSSLSGIPSIKVAAGVAIGTCSHAAGTSKAIELGEVEGAMSGIAIGVSGILTVLIAVFL